MFSKNRSQSLLTVLTLGATMALAGCSGSDIANKSSNVTKQGTMDIETVTVGMPEADFKKAVFSFSLDDTPIAHTGGKNQYMSRNRTKDGAVILIQCKNGKCFQMQRLYKDGPISREDGQLALKAMLPADAPPQSKVDDKQLSNPKIKMPIEEYTFGDAYFANITYDGDKKVFAVTVDKPSVLTEGAATTADPAASTESKPAQ